MKGLIIFIIIAVRIIIWMNNKNKRKNQDTNKNQRVQMNKSTANIRKNTIDKTINKIALDKEKSLERENIEQENKINQDKYDDSLYLYDFIKEIMKMDYEDFNSLNSSFKTSPQKFLEQNLEYSEINDSYDLALKYLEINKRVLHVTPDNIKKYKLSEFFEDLVVFYGLDKKVLDGIDDFIYNCEDKIYEYNDVLLELIDSKFKFENLGVIRLKKGNNRYLSAINRRSIDRLEVEKFDFSLQSQKNIKDTRGYLYGYVDGIEDEISISEGIRTNNKVLGTLKNDTYVKIYETEDLLWKKIESLLKDNRLVGYVNNNKVKQIKT